MLLLVFSGVFFLNSCSFTADSNKASDVDFSLTQDIEISFNDNIYNTRISYNGKEYEFIYGDDCGTVSGAAVLMDDQQYTVSFKEMVFSGETTSLPHNFLPYIVYSFFKTNGSIITLSQYDSNEECFLFNCKVFNNTVLLKAYDNNDGTLALSLAVK